MFLSRKHRFILPGVVYFLMIAVASLAAQTDRQWLPTGLSITPLAPYGVDFQPLNPQLPTQPLYQADMAVTSALSPDGKTLLVLTSGYNQLNDANGNVDASYSNEYVFVFDVSEGTPRQTQVVQIKVNAFDGLVWNPDGKAFYVSGGGDDLVHVFARKEAGGVSSWVEGTQIQLGHNGVGLGLYGITPVVAGVAITPDGKHLLAANFENDSVSAVDVVKSTVVSEVDLRPGKINPKDRGKPGGSYPYWVTISRDGKKAYVSSQRDREIVVLGLTDFAKLRVLARIPLHGQPNKMTLNHAGTRLYVAEDNTDTVSAIDTAHDRVVETLGTIAPAWLFPNKKNFKGAGPDGLAVSADDRTLYVTNGGTNSVAVIELDRDDDGSHIAGLIPTAWYPTSVTPSRDGSRLYVLNGKSMPGPNPQACFDAQAVRGNSVPCLAENQYIYQIMSAGLATIPLPAAGELAQLTRTVGENNHFVGRKKNPEAEAMMDFLSKRIHHVIYVVKENKTYDQVLGDLEVGNGDPSLASLGGGLSPNHHQLARRFVTLDNTYCSGEVSGDGWNWSAAARVTEEEQKTIQLDYAGRAATYDFDGTNRNINVGLATLAERRAANPETPNDADLLAGTRDIAEHDGLDGEESGGYIWNAAKAAHKTVRNYGFEYIDLNRYNLDPSDPNYIPPVRDPHAAGLVVSRATKALLATETDPYYRGWDMNIPDYWLYKEWAREFDGYVKNGDLPDLELVALPHDHFGSFDTAIDGVNTVETQMADNDYALGLLVEKVAHSKYKDDTVIFVIEDDAQDGPDHVDAHRTIAYALGAYVKQGVVVSEQYSTINMLRTIEDLLHIEPMGLNDGLENPMSAVFSAEYKKWSYRAIVPEVLRTTQLPLPAVGKQVARMNDSKGSWHDAAYWSAMTRGLDLTHADHANAGQWNRVLWTGLKGDVPYPTKRSRRDLRRGRKQLLTQIASLP